MTAHLGDILVYTLLGFSVLYPLFLWFTPRHKIDSGFYNFNLGLSGTIGGMALILSWATDMDQMFVFGIAGWLGLHLLVTYLYWNNEKISNAVISFVSFIGSLVFILFARSMFPDSNPYLIAFTGYVSQSILAGVMFAMILGHWYLNVIALPINLLKKATMSLWGLLIIRSIWDIVYLSTNTIVDTFGISHNLWMFMFQFDGFLLAVAFFMGNIVPITLNFFIWRTLKLQATQSATGLLYVSIVSILFGDLLFKYYLLQYGFLV